MKDDSRTFQVVEKGIGGKIAFAAAVVGVAAGGAGRLINPAQFYHSYLTAYIFWTSLALGALFFVMLHYMVGATWSVVLRRLAENVMVLIPIMAVLFIPIIPGIHGLYHWSHEDYMAGDAILQSKAAFLNIPFFLVRAVFYFLIWIILSVYLYRISLAQDSGTAENHIRKARRVSAPGLILFAVTITLASFDWLMSLDAHWYSTIFGVYIFSGALLGFLAFLIFLILGLRKLGCLKDTITPEHYHDLGKLTFAFVIFWAYMVFSQYFLIWYGNIPEETIWYLHRWEHSWKVVSLILVFGHFAIPFFVLFPHAPKRHPVILGVISVWILLMHWLDIYWIVMPNIHPHGFSFSWIDIAVMLAIGGIFIGAMWQRIVSHALVPVRDPKLEDSMNLISH